VSVAQETLTALDRRPCLVCQCPIEVRHEPWSARCPACGTWASSLEPAINEATLHEVDEVSRVGGLAARRRLNYTRIMRRGGARRPLPGTRVLDVGTGHGWFLDAVREAGAEGVGVEPDEGVAAVPRGRGLQVLTGYFPDVVDPDERFGVIAFNDVLEHLPDPRAVLAACHALLDDDGLLSINIPNASGLAYRTAQLLKRAGFGGPYERLWQTGLPSPHLHYFTPGGLQALLSQSGFRLVTDERLAAVTREGLWDRVHTFRSVTPGSVAGFAALWLAAPVLNRRANSDILFLLAERA
jgi:SAM-dependent methyltransferase